MTYQEAQDILASKQDDENTPDQQAALDLIIEVANTLPKYKAYLDQTDWYYARKMETGEDVPSEVVSKRLEARAYIRDNK